MNLCTWNIKGLNKPHKQKELRLFLRKYKVDVMECLETRVKERKSARIISQVARELNIEDQFIHYEVHEPNSNFRTTVTMIYASNDNNQRSQLWRTLIQLGSTIQDCWLLCGDFNNVLYTDDRIGTPVTQGETQGLQDLLNTLQLTQLKSLGWYYTWCNKQELDKRVYSRIDWAFGNFDWMQQYGHIEAEFLNPEVSDHSPLLIKCSQGHQMRSLHPKPFKLYSSVMENAEFKKIVNRVWEQNIQAEPMHKVWQRLKILKGDLKELNAYMVSYKQHLNHARHKFEVIQTKLMVQHLDQDLIEQERRALAEEVGDDVCDAVKQFFATGKMHKGISSTAVTLIPKVQNPSYVKEYRPIACCTTLYKTITKVITARIKRVIGGYNRKGISPRCVLKVDLRKTYDTLEWTFMERVLLDLGFPYKFTRWIMDYISSVTYSLNINGGLTKPFKGRRGIRQGDPMSPYLFVLAMKYLQREFAQMMKNKVFKFHPRCQKLGVVHVCFADDLLMFCRADLQSIRLLRQTFQKFSEACGLQANAEKSAAYLAGVSVNQKQDILQELGFPEGTLPFKYLGVLLATGKLTVIQCWPLVERITQRINCWTARLLSYAGRVQLIKAAVTKHLWAVAKKKDCLWIKWIHTFYIKHHTLEHMPIPKNAAWVVRKILESKKLIGDVQGSVVETLDMVRTLQTYSRLTTKGGMDKSLCHKKKWTMGNCYLCLWHDGLHYMEGYEQSSIPGRCSKCEQHMQGNNNSYTHERAGNTTLAGSTFNTQQIPIKDR
ncbi:uncharacterized protein LOC142162181 [Nicotiana tabacum]|uniref:Uncharacterized protein LOC142162181 n=1 Tax=Nicotiana tabacum TaxID=4097 RepID=A0AC58RPI1_TOBAC